MEMLSDDIIIYDISPRLNRLTKNSYKCINKKFSELIISQDILNKNYTIAKKNNNLAMMLEWRKKGALSIHEEVYNIFTENKKLSAKMLWFQHTNTPEPFCVESAFAYGISMNNKPFITFLLEESQPSHDSNIITVTIALSKKFERREIIATLEKYVEQNKKPKYPYCYGMGAYHDSVMPPAL
jgi:hypothetical protein